MTDITSPHLLSPHEQTIPQQENAIKIVLLLLMLLGCFYTMGYLVTLHNLSISINIIALLLFFLLAVFSSMLMLAMAILAHDGVHRVLFKNAAINDLVSGLLSALGGGVPFYANRQYHLTHHRYTHQGASDPEHTMHNKPFWQAILIGSFIGLYLQYKILLKNLTQGSHDSKYRARGLKDLGFIGAAIAFYGLSLSIIEVSPLYSILPAFLVFPFTFAYRAMSDHYGLPRVKRKSEQYREILENDDVDNEENAQISRQQATGWVVHTYPWLEWLWSHVNYHEVHHKFPYLSHVHLKQAFEATKNSYPYREVKGYTQSIAALRLTDYYNVSGNL